VAKGISSKSTRSIAGFRLTSELTALHYALQNPAVGWKARFWIGCALAYALSPVDLIPDFIPILGYLDDLIIVPLLIGMAVASIPAPILQECRERAQKEPLQLSKNRWMLVVILGIWLTVPYCIFTIIRK